MKLFDFQLSTRITAAAVILVIAGAVALMYAEEARLHDVYLSERHGNLDRGIQAQKLRLTQTINTLRQDVLFLSNVPPISGITRAAQNHGYDARYGNTTRVWQERLQQIFSVFSIAHPDYYQIRYIGMADAGREIVRIDNRGGEIEVTPPDQLQSKGDRDYFKATLGLHKGEVYLSEFNLNQEHGVIEQPPKPTLRAATPVFGPTGEIFGIVIINMDAAALLKAATQELMPDVQAYITNMNGQYLLHPDARQAFAFELGSKANIGTDFPSLKTLFDTQIAGHLLWQPNATGTSRLGISPLIAAERIHFDPAQPARFLLLGYVVPDGATAKRFTSIPASQIIGGFIVMLLVAYMSMLVLHRMFAPLRQLTSVAEQIAGGDRNIRLQPNGGGEIGTLNNAFSTMLDNLSQREQEILRLNEELEQRYHALFDNMLDGYAYCRMLFENDIARDFICLDTNSAFERLTGLKQPAGKKISELIPGIRESNPEMFEIYGRVALTGKPERFEIYVGPLEAWFSVTTYSSRKEHFVAIFDNITEQKRVQQEIATLLYRNKLLMQTSMDGIHILDGQGNILEANDAFCRMLGYTPEEMAHLNVADWDVQWSGDELRARITDLIGKSATFETLHRKKDGSLINVEICATGAYTSNGPILFASSRDITARKQTEAILLQHHRVIETSIDGFWMTDLNGKLLEVNQAYAEMSGYSAEELLNMSINELEAREQPADTAAHIAKVMTNGHDRFESRHRRKNGHEFDVEISANYLADTRKLAVFCRDISERKKTEEALRVAAITFETNDAIMITGADANIIRVNRAFTDITGYSLEEVQGKNPSMMNSGRHDKAFYVEMWQQLLHDGSWSGEIWDRRKNGQIYPKWLSITAVKDERGEAAQYVAIFSDITLRKQAEEEIRNLAFYDPLTHLPNRRLFIDRFRAALPISERHGSYGAAMFIDLDKFKIINDTLGHDYGDLLLIEVAVRIKSCVREMDTVARLGGDEFTVLIEGISKDKDDASRKIGLVAEKIRESLAQPYQLKEHLHHSSPSIGICLFRGNEEPVDVLLRHADMAMYQAKEAGRNAVRFYDPAMQHIVTAHADMENELRSALAQQQLQLYFQMQVDNDNRMLGAEGLLRWNHPQRGVVAPDEFIPIAEQGTLIFEIGNWVLDSACQQLARWSENARTRDLTLAINVSSKQFAMPDYVDGVARAIRRHKINPARLKLELTEGMVLANLAAAIEKMHALKALGVRLSIDDFGTGYSSLSYLKLLPIDQLKIDQSFVKNMASDPNDAILVHAIIELANNFHLNVIAEGVETDAQRDFLKDNHCIEYQGFLFGKAVPIEEFEALLGAGSDSSEQP